MGSPCRSAREAAGFDKPPPKSFVVRDEHESAHRAPQHDLATQLNREPDGGRRLSRYRCCFARGVKDQSGPYPGWTSVRHRGAVFRSGQIALPSATTGIVARAGCCVIVNMLRGGRPCWVAEIGLDERFPSTSGRGEARTLRSTVKSSGETDAGSRQEVCCLVQKAR